MPTETLTHPKLPGKTVTVSERTAKQYRAAGWRGENDPPDPDTRPDPTGDPARPAARTGRKEA